MRIYCFGSDLILTSVIIFAGMVFVHLCDNECSEQGFKYFQLAAILSEEGGAVHTIILYKQCDNERRVQQGEQPVTAAQ